MTTPELLNFIKGERAKGTTKEAIEKSLIDAGWNPADVAEGFSVIDSPAPVAPVAAPTPAPMPVEVHKDIVMPVSTSHKSHFGLLFSVILLLVLGGGAGYAYYAGYFSSKPVTVAELINNMEAQPSVKFNAKAAIKISPVEGGESPLAMFGIDEVSMQMFGESMRNTSKLGENGEVLMSLTAGGFEGAAEVRIVDDISYLKFSKMPELGLGADLSYFKDKWFSMDVNNYPKELLGTLAISGASPQQEEQIKSLLVNANLVNMLSKEPGENISGVYTDKYTFDLNKEGLISFVQSLESISAPGLETPIPFDAESMRSDLNKITNFKGAIFIGKSDRLPYKFEVAFSVPMEEFGSLDISFEFGYSEWGVPITVEKPEVSEDFFSVFGGGMAIPITE